MLTLQPTRPLPRSPSSSISSPKASGSKGPNSKVATVPSAVPSASVEGEIETVGQGEKVEVRLGGPDPPVSAQEKLRSGRGAVGPPESEAVRIRRQADEVIPPLESNELTGRGPIRPRGEIFQKAGAGPGAVADPGAPHRRGYRFDPP